MNEQETVCASTGTLETQLAHTNSAHTINGGVEAHPLTIEERRRGGLKTQERKRREREQLEEAARERAIEELTGYLLGAVRVLGQQLDSEDERVAQAAARFIVEHRLGRAAQALAGKDGGPIEIRVVSMLAAAAAELESPDVIDAEVVEEGDAA